jgi:hypothetical protein
MKALKTLVLGVFACMFLLTFGGIAFRETITKLQENTEITAIEPEARCLKSEAFFTGPLVAHVGELCVFRLNNPNERADWVIVPPAMCYVDSSGSSLAFASNVPAKYTIVAAIVENGVPKILQHVCEYGVSPEPSPSPNPPPTPTPGPIPVSLGEWIKQNLPEAGRGQCAALAACYEATADAIEKNAVRTTDAAFSTLRTATQTKISSEIWGTFLDQLSAIVMEKLGNGDVKKLGTIFTEIAEGLKAVADLGDVLDVGVPDVGLLTSESPTPISDAGNMNPEVCPDPTGKACQPVPALTTLSPHRRSR